MRRALVVTALLLTGCGGPAAQNQAAPAAAGEMTLEGAKKLVMDFAAKHPTVDAADPLRNPGSLDDVLEILKRDQIELFAAGVAFAGKQEGKDAMALHAQLELAWGEASTILADILREDAARLRPLRTKLEKKEALTDEEKEELASLRATIGEEAETAAALLKLAADHLAKGQALAKKVIGANPEDYVGYRVAADYYRLQKDWEQFAAMVKKIEETNPESVGLAFLKGVAAADRDNDAAKAKEHLEGALAQDPAFTRAQTQLLWWANTVEARFQQLEKLVKLNPKHQVVVWAGDRIRNAYEASQTKAP